MGKDILKEVEHAIYFGIYFSHDMSRAYQCDQVAKKVTENSGFTRSNLAGVPKLTKYVTYTSSSLVRPGMGYPANIRDSRKTFSR